LRRAPAAAHEPAAGVVDQVHKDNVKVGNCRREHHDLLQQLINITAWLLICFETSDAICKSRGGRSRAPPGCRSACESCPVILLKDWARNPNLTLRGNIDLLVKLPGRNALRGFGELPERIGNLAGEEVRKPECA